MATTLAKGDLALLHRRGASLAHRMRAESRILQYIFQSPGEEGILARLGEVLPVLQLAYLANKATWSVSKALIRRVCQQLEQQNMLYRLMLDNDAYRTVQTGTLGADTSTLEGVGQVLAGQTDPAWSGWQSLTSEMYRYVGESGERSVQFALHLLEDVVPLIRTAARWRDRPTGIDTDGNLGAARAIQIILNAARAPVHPDMVVKDWLLRLIEEASQSFAADQVLESIENVLTLGVPDGKMRVATPLPEALIELTLGYMTSHPDPLNPIALLSERHRKMWEALSAKRVRKMEDDKRQGNELLSRYRERREEIAAALAGKCEEMARGLRRGLRPDGADHIQITVGPLYHAGVRAVIFHPEGRTYPNVGVEILVRKETPHLISFMFELDLADTPEAEQRMERWFDGMRDALWNLMYPIEDLRGLMSSIIIDAMYRIVMPGTRPLREPQNDAAGVKKAGAPKVAVSVRPYIRHLPPSHAASEEAVARATEALGYRLPPGVTFVGAFYRGDKQIGYHLPEPFAGYTNDDVLHFLK